MEYLFETARLGVRAFTMEDAQRLYENHLEEAVKRWIPNESYADLEEARDAAAFFADSAASARAISARCRTCTCRESRMRWKSASRSVKDTVEKDMPRNWWVQ